MKNFVKTTFKFAFLTILFGGLFVFLSNYAIKKTTQNRLYSNANEIPAHKVGLILGTNKQLQSGRENLYFRFRMEAAEKLYKAGKVEYFIVSGDNRKKGYNEPEDMRDDLIRRGVPANKIYLDYAGFRTLDSVVRCKEIFGQEDIIIVSQQFHNERALFLAKAKGMDNVHAFNARDVSRQYGRSAIKVKIREVGAKTYAVLDLMLNTQPKYLGEKVIVGEDAIVRSQ